MLTNAYLNPTTPLPPTGSQSRNKTTAASASRPKQAAARAFVISQGWTLIGEYSDIADGKDGRRSGFQAALTRCRQLGAVLVAARLDRITRRAHTLSRLLEDGVSIRAADMPELLRVGDDAAGGLQETYDGFFRDDRLSRFRAMQDD